VVIIYGVGVLDEKFFTNREKKIGKKIHIDSHRYADRHENRTFFANETSHPIYQNFIRIIDAS